MDMIGRIRHPYSWKNKSEREIARIAGLSHDTGAELHGHGVRVRARRTDSQSPRPSHPRTLPRNQSLAGSHAHRDAVVPGQVQRQALAGPLQFGVAKGPW